MLVSFDTDVVEKWANFSGDYNPIHFDPEAATNLSGAGLVAHGMLVLLPVKQAMTEALSAEILQSRPCNKVNSDLPTKPWVRLKSSFRQPVPQSRDVMIDVSSAGSKANYAVVEQDRKTTYFQGVLSNGLPPDAPLVGESIAIDQKDLLQRWEYFQGSFNRITSAWIFIDALIFSEFVEQHVSDLISMAIAEREGPQGNAERSRFVVQTSQCVWFDHLSLQNLAYPGLFNLTYRYKRGEWMADNDRIIGTVDLEARLDDRRVLHSEVGLLLQRFD